MQVVIDLGRSAREKAGISLKTPVKSITVVCKNEGTLKALEKLQTYIKGELNAWEVRGRGAQQAYAVSAGRVIRGVPCSANGPTRCWVVIDRAMSWNVRGIGCLVPN